MNDCTACNEYQLNNIAPTCPLHERDEELYYSDYEQELAQDLWLEQQYEEREIESLTENI